MGQVVLRRASFFSTSTPFSLRRLDLLLVLRLGCLLIHSLLAYDSVQHTNDALALLFCFQLKLLFLELIRLEELAH